MVYLEILLIQIIMEIVDSQFTTCLGGSVKSLAAGLARSAFIPTYRSTSGSYRSTIRLSRTSRVASRMGRAGARADRIRGRPESGSTVSQSYNLGRLGSGRVPNP
jgi:hypothetical protein